jgi:hypothetical protein
MMLMKKSVPNPISDATRAAAVRLWEQFPRMKPVGAARQAKDLAELEALLKCEVEGFLKGMILGLGRDKYRHQWVATFKDIAENLPKIRAFFGAETTKPKRQSYTTRWLEENKK